MTMTAETGFFERDGFKIRYAVEGSGRDTLVLGSALYYPRTFSMRLRQHLRFVFADHRGFAEAPKQIPSSSFHLDTILDDFEVLRKTLGLGVVVAVGNSGHAFMALEYAKKYPEHVSHVVMIGVAPDLSADSAAAAERRWAESVDPERKAAMKDNLLRFPDESLANLSQSEAFVRIYIRNGPRAWYDPRFDASGLWSGVEPNEVLFRLWSETFSKIDVTRGLGDLQKPVFLALGEYDYLVAPPSSWDRVRGEFKDLTVRVFERSGHTPQLEQSELFDEELLGWLDTRR